jgi:hypothetical protein
VDSDQITDLIYEAIDRLRRHLSNFSGNAVALVLASTPYDPEDYIRDKAEFVASLPPIEEGYFERRARAATLEELQQTR